VLGEFLLEVKSVNGFAGDVSISCTGGPPKSVCRDFPADGACEGQSSGAGAIKDPVAAATSAASSAVGTSSIGAYLATNLRLLAAITLQQMACHARSCRQHRRP